jgi:hypothetical protein
MKRLKSIALAAVAGSVRLSMGGDHLSPGCPFETHAVSHFADPDRPVALSIQIVNASWLGLAFYLSTLDYPSLTTLFRILLFSV